MALTSPMPGNRCRTMARPQRIPNTVLSGTATIATSSVSFSACTAVGFEIAAQNGCKPCSNARQKMRHTGATRMITRYPSDPKRIRYLPIMAHRPTSQAADREQHRERDHEQQHGERRRTLLVAAVQALKGIERRDFGLERQIAGDEDHRAELADRARKRERHTGQKRRQQVRE